MRAIATMIACAAAATTTVTVGPAMSVAKITNRKFGISLAKLDGEMIRPPNTSSAANSWINHDANSSNSAFASFRSRVSNPSVNHP